MGLIKEYKRHSARVTRGPRWKKLRQLALERDNWKCQHCGSQQRLECHHVKPVRTHPELAYTLSNLMMLCGRCHAAVTRIEIGLGRPDPKREAWKKLVRDVPHTPSNEGNENA